MPVISLLNPETLAALEAWARVNAEFVTYAAFFGFMTMCGTLEFWVARSHAKPHRARRWSTNALLTLGWILTGASMPLSLLTASDWSRANHIGLLNLPLVTPFAAVVLGMLARSLTSYVTHVAMHKIPMFWRLHRVHHMDTHLDISTTARIHPIEAVASLPFAIAGVIVLGIPPAAVLLYEILDAAIVVFSHANIRLPERVDRALRLVIVTPNMHRIHHSTLQLETDSNYGATFSFWDRALGTYRSKTSESLTDQTIGLSEVQDRRAYDVLWQLASPLFGVARLRGMNS